MSRRPTQPKRRGSQIAQAYRNAHEVVSACMGLALLTGGGYWLDNRWGCAPVLMICGVVLGSLTAATSLRRLLKRLDQESHRSQKAASGQNLPTGQSEGDQR